MLLVFTYPGHWQVQDCLHFKDFLIIDKEYKVLKSPYATPGMQVYHFIPP